MVIKSRLRWVGFAPHMEEMRNSYKSLARNLGELEYLYWASMNMAMKFHRWQFIE
jgi:hypothetical protein